MSAHPPMSADVLACACEFAAAHRHYVAQRAAYHAAQSMEGKQAEADAHVAGAQALSRLVAAIEREAVMDLATPKLVVLS